MEFLRLAEVHAEHPEHQGYVGSYLAAVGVIGIVRREVAYAIRE